MTNRRELIKFGLAAGVAGAVSVPAHSWAAPTTPKVLALQSLHTGEKIEACFWENGKYVPDACNALNRVLRDHRSGESHMMDPGLFEMLTAMAAKMERKPQFQIISGYRSPKTNAMLHARSKGVASNSQHTQGKAIDVRVEGVELANLRRAALAVGAGGVGYYPVSNFVHVDTGRVRQWSGA